MGKFIARRLLLQFPILLLGVSILLFTIFQMAPGDPLAQFISQPGMTVEQVERIAESYGVHRHPVQQYFDWVGSIIQGDLGVSFEYRIPVSEAIGYRLFPTFLLSFSALILSLVVAIPAGIVSATKQYSKLDYSLTTFAFFGISIPNFFFALLLIFLISLRLGLLPISGMTTAGVEYTPFWQAIDILRHLILPMIVLGLSSTATFMRYTRSSMLEVIRQDYIRTARAKGLKERVVIYKHALRNAMIPIITLMGFQLPVLFSGAVITEQVFGWPGMGSLMIDAVYARDYNLLMGINMFLAFLIILGNLLADIAYAFVDPRIRYD